MNPTVYGSNHIGTEKETAPMKKPSARKECQQPKRSPMIGARGTELQSIFSGGSSTEGSPFLRRQSGERARGPR